MSKKPKQNQNTRYTLAAAFHATNKKAVLKKKGGGGVSFMADARVPTDQFNYSQWEEIKGG